MLSDRLLLRWKTHPERRREFRLELRSRCRFEGDVYVHAYLTRLWFDPTMEDATKKAPAGINTASLEALEGGGDGE